MEDIRNRRALRHAEEINLVKQALLFPLSYRHPFRRARLLQAIMLRRHISGGQT